MGVKKGVISTALSTLAELATAEVKKSGKFVIPGVAMIKTRLKKATKAGKREVFGKVVMVKAKPAKTVVKAFPAKALRVCSSGFFLLLLLLFLLRSPRPHSLFPP